MSDSCNVQNYYFKKRLYYMRIGLLLLAITIFETGCEMKPTSKLKYCAQSNEEVCETKKRFIFLVNVKECVSCRQQFHQVLTTINTKTPTKNIFWVFDDTRKILAEKAVRDYTEGMENLASSVLVSSNLYDELQGISSFNKRSNLIVLDEKDSCIYSLFNFNSNVIESSNMPFF